ncbi:hypothetical protein [Antribacter gilvus]|uniref:hypothetical protein n=1 Tax=Antribacter gilvus TaxID=2304675 RepID=UPI000F79DC0D|nr:hypothetical protein [Antribacter gilvus]
MTLATLLDPAPRPALPVVTPHQVGGRAAWADLLQAGALELLHDDAAVPRGTVLTAVHRALALAAVVPPRCVLAGRSAAWVHTGLYRGALTVRLPTGTPTEVAYPVGTHHPAPRPGLLVHQVPGLHRDTDRVAGVPVMSPVRAAVEVACRVPHAEAVTLLRGLAGSGADLRLAARLLEQRQRVVGRPAARRALSAAVAAQPG